jgi:1,4-dihydroxy-2-naphthoyl-CoA synthase
VLELADTVACGVQLPQPVKNSYNFFKQTDADVTSFDGEYSSLFG